jgi:allophanate hydrolase
MLETLDCVLTPTCPRPVTLDELEAEPVQRNADLGYYTNFMNLLDYAAVSVPAVLCQTDCPPASRCLAGPLPTSISGWPMRFSAYRLPLAGGARLEPRRLNASPAMIEWRWWSAAPIFLACR